MITRAPEGMRCDFCRDNDASYRFGEYGMGICGECAKSIKALIDIQGAEEATGK